MGERLAATNAAIVKLNQYIHWWYSLTLVERRLAENFSILVESCEAVAYNDMVWQPPASRDERVGGKAHRPSKAPKESQAGDRKEGGTPKSKPRQVDTTSATNVTFQSVAQRVSSSAGSQ